MNSSDLTIVEQPAPDSKKLTRLQRASLALPEMANELEIVDEQSFVLGGGILTECKKLERMLEGLLRPGIKEADKLHKGLVQQLKAYTTPLKEAKRIADSKMAEYRARERRKREAQEAAAREAALKAEEEERLRHVEHLEALNRKDEADALLERPLAAPVVSVESTVPKIEGQSVTTHWRARVIDQLLVPNQYKVVDMTQLNLIARSSKGLATVPGVEFYAEETTTVRGV